MQSQDTRNMMIVGGATVIGGVLNYLVHPLAVRMLSTADFGEFAALLSMINIMGFIMSAGTIITLKLIADHDSRSDFMYYLKDKLTRPLIGVGLCVCLLIGLCALWIAGELQISHVWGVVIMGVSIVFSFYGIILNAILQSGGWFKSLSAIGILGSAVKLICVTITLRGIGGSSTSAVGAIVIAGLIGIALTEYLVRRHLGHPSTTDIMQYDGTLISQLKQQGKSYLNLIIITVMMGVLTNSDVLIAQHVFGSESGGIYASVAIIAKFVVFIGLAAETVLLPKLLKADTKPNRSQIGSIIGLLWVFGLISLLGSRWLGGWILDMLKPGLGIYQPLLIGAIVINWCVLTLSISSKILTNKGSRVALWMIGIGAILWYSVATMSVDLSSYVSISSIILLVMSVGLQGWWRYSTPGQTLGSST